MLIAELATNESPSMRKNRSSHASGVDRHWHCRTCCTVALSAALPNANSNKMLIKKNQNSFDTKLRSAPLRVRCRSARVARSITFGISRYMTMSTPRLGRNWNTKPARYPRPFAHATH